MDDDIPYDIAIIGYGPAGITAAIYATRKKYRVILFGEESGGEVVNSGEIDNWPGGGRTNGVDLATSFIKHLSLYPDVNIVRQKIINISRTNHNFTVTTSAKDSFTAKSVIYAAGRHPRQLQIPGEAEFKNRGVSYCANCDAPLFSDKTVAVVGGGNTGAEAVIMLQKIAKRIYLLHNTPELSADAILVNNFTNDPKVEIIFNAKVTSVAGNKMVTSLSYENLANHNKETLPVDGVFVAIGGIPNTEPVKNLVALDKLGAIVTERYGYTKIPGFFAAGDATNTRDTQIIVASGQGCSATLSAADYLNRHRQD